MIATLLDFPIGFIGSFYWVFWLCYNESWIVPLVDSKSTLFAGLGLIIGVWTQAGIIGYTFIRILHRIILGKWAW